MKWTFLLSTNVEFQIVVSLLLFPLQFSSISKKSVNLMTIFYSERANREGNKKIAHDNNYMYGIDMFNWSPSSAYSAFKLSWLNFIRNLLLFCLFLNHDVIDVTEASSFRWMSRSSFEVFLRVGVLFPDALGKQQRHKDLLGTRSMRKKVK